MESAPDVRKKYDYWAYNGHIHGRKGQADWSSHDERRAKERVVVTRADANDVDPNGHLKPGHTVKRAIPLKNGGRETRDVYKQPETSSSGISPGMAGSLTSASLYLSFGQGPESINRANGTP